MSTVDDEVLIKSSNLYCIDVVPEIKKPSVCFSVYLKSDLLT